MIDVLNWFAASETRVVALCVVLLCASRVWR